jgi:hypothetical protein
VFIHAIASRTFWRNCPGDPTWHRLAPPGFVVQGLDAEAVLDPSGTVFYSDLWLGSASITASRNGGTTWTTNNPLSLLPPVDDRQWLASIGNNEVLLVTNQIPSGITVTRCALPPAPANAVVCAPTWMAKPVATRFCVCPPGQPAASADGSLVVVPYFTIQNVNPALVPPLQSDLLIEAAVSRDRGLTWSTVPVARASGDPGIFPVAAIDAANNVYVSWAAKRSSQGDWEVWLARSLDAAQTFDPAPMKVSQGGSNVLPWIAAGAPGKASVVWYHNDQRGHPEDVGGAWYVDFATSDDLDQPAPTVRRARVSAAPIHHGGLSISGLGGSADRDLLDFFQVALDAQGMAHVAFADDATDGHDGHAHVYYARQLS